MINIQTKPKQYTQISRTYLDKDTEVFICHVGGIERYQLRTHCSMS